MNWSNLKADYERLGTITAVAREYGVSVSAVSVRAKRQGIEVRHPRALRTDWSELRSLYCDQGLTYQQLTDHYGCSLHAIQNAIKREGIKPRPHGLPVGYIWTDERRAAHRVAVDRPEWRAKMREILLQRLPTMRGPSANSPLERMLHTALIKAGYSFRTQRTLLGRYCVDIILFQQPIVIEADGALHHLRKNEDAARDADLTAAGYRVFRFSGTQINKDPNECIREVTQACGLVPDTEPIADIRNGRTGPDHPSWAGGPRTMPCDYCGNEFTEASRNTRNCKKRFCTSKCYGGWLREHPEESNRWLKIDWSDLPTLYVGGMTMRQLASHYGCGVHAVQGAMTRLGVQARPAHRRPRS